MRLPLATDLKARVGTPDKDARVKNGIIEIRGESSVVRQRPGVSEASATDLGLFAQGGMQFGESLVFMNDDTLYLFDVSDVPYGSFPSNSEGFSVLASTPLFIVTDKNTFVVGSLVMVVDSDNGKVHTTSNMVDWTSQDWPAVFVSNSWVFNARLFSIDENGDVYSTANGLTWSYHGPASPYGALYLYDHCEFDGYVYCFFTGAPKVRRSSDGINFYAVSTSGLSSSPAAIDCPVDTIGSKIYFVRDASTTNVKSSTDGSTWSVETTSLSSQNFPALVAHEEELYLIGGSSSATVQKSADGATWAEVPLDPTFLLPYAYDNKTAISFGGNLYYLAWNTTTSKTDIWLLSGSVAYTVVSL